MSCYASKPISLDHLEEEIRLVTIHPGQGRISCSLSQTHIRDAPPYEALSYVWGHANMTSEILLDGHPFGVSMNLEAVLQNLRSEEERTLWIDAICINQESSEERSSQVLLMRRVYEKAARTIVWLGEATPKSRAAFNLMQNKKLEGLFAHDSDGAQTGREYGPGVKELLREFRRVSARKAYRGLIEDIVERPWFTRVWVVQEVAVSKNITVICGADTMAWSRFSRILYIILTISHKLPYGDLLGEGRYTFLTQARICNMVKSGGRAPLVILVATARFLKATDKRDSVYAFYGLASDVDDNDTLVKPDYSPSVSVVEVYANLIQHAINSLRSIDVICIRRNYQRALDSWPSWVPDWAEPPPVATDLFSEILQGSSFNNMESIDSYGKVVGPCLRPLSANKGTMALATITKIPPVLSAQGVCVDFITHLSEPCLMDSKIYTECEFESWDRVIEDKFGDCRGHDGEPISHISAECKELFKYSTKGSPLLMPGLSTVHKSLWGPATWQLKKRKKAWKEFARANPTTIQTYVGGGTVVEAYTKTLFLDKVLGSGINTAEGYEIFRSGSWRKTGFAYMEVPHSVLNRKLFISIDGYIGVGPLSVQEDDFICVLFGCFVPVLIRRVGNDHFLIGECYVHGLMFGEAIDMLENHEREPALFRLH